MSKFRTISLITCILLVVLCSCNSSKSASKKRRKQAPCDCPKFNYVPQPDNVYKTYAFNVTNVMSITNV